MKQKHWTYYEPGLSTSIKKSLTKNQEEVDNKLILHSHRTLKSNETSVIIPSSPSGDTDGELGCTDLWVVPTVALIYEFRNRVLIDDGFGDNKKVMRLSNKGTEKDLVDALTGFRAFTGNDYISSFFRKGK